MPKPPSSPAIIPPPLPAWWKPLPLTVELLAQHPALGRPGRVEGTRELVVPDTPYLVPYRVRGHAVEILRVFHGARKWPKKL